MRRASSCSVGLWKATSTSETIPCDLFPDIAFPPHFLKKLQQHLWNDNGALINQIAFRSAWCLPPRITGANTLIAVASRTTPCLSHPRYLSGYDAAIGDMIDVCTGEREATRGTFRLIPVDDRNAAVAAVRGRGVMSRFLPSSSRSGARALQRSGRSFGTCQPCETHPHKQAKGHGGNRAKFIRATCCDVYAKGDKNQPCGCCDSQRKWCRPRVSAPQPYRGNYVRKARQEIEPKHEIHIGSQCSLLLRPTKQSFCPRDNGQ